MIFVMHIVGARPNFMKADPVIRAMEKDGGFRQMLVHTGQHYDDNMSKVFFDDLGIRKPDVNLDVRQRTEDGGRRTEIGDQRSEVGGLRSNVYSLKSSFDREAQIDSIERAFEPVLLSEKPDWVFVYGDVNSTIACARVAAKHGVKIAHVEAGLRSFDMTMPEEVNRIETDQLADLLFVTEESGLENLRREWEDRRLQTTDPSVAPCGSYGGHGCRPGTEGFLTTKHAKDPKRERGCLSPVRHDSARGRASLEHAEVAEKNRTTVGDSDSCAVAQASGCVAYGEGNESGCKNIQQPTRNVEHPTLCPMPYAPCSSQPTAQQPNNEQPDNRTRQIHFVGNTMIDTVARLLPEAKVERVAKLLSCYVARDISRSLNSTTEQLNNLTTYPAYALVTLHRPGNVDDPETLARIIKQLEEVAKDMPVLFPVHPRTAQLLKQLGAEGIEHSAEGEIRGLWSTAVPRTDLRSGTGVYGLQSEPSGLHLLPPQGYLDFLALQANAAVVITDSGGIQEETSYLGVPCLTVRPNTERPVTIEKGTNRLCKVDELHQLVQSCLKFKVPGIKTSPCTLDMAPFTARSRPAIPLWDGHAAERIVEVMKGAGGACETIDHRQ